MPSIRFDFDKKDRCPDGTINFRRVYRKDTGLPSSPTWRDGEQRPYVLRDDIHEWFVAMNISYTLHWRHDDIVIDGIPRLADFRWEVDVEDPKDAMLVKLTWFT